MKRLAKIGRVIRRFFRRSIRWQIILANFAALLIIILGNFFLSDLRRSLTEARLDSLTERAQGLVQFIEEVAVEPGNPGQLDHYAIRQILMGANFPTQNRVRIFDHQGQLITDSYLITDIIVEKELPPVGQAPDWRQKWLSFHATFYERLTAFFRLRETSYLTQRYIDEEVSQALNGEIIRSGRESETGEQFFSVSVPVQHVQTVLGVVTVETGGVDQIIASARLAQIPFIIMATIVSFIFALLLTLAVAQPLRNLAKAANRVRRFDVKGLDVGNLERRRDEIGDLAKSLKAMTQSLWERIDANERFAADVAHELKNPLTSLRSATETLALVKDPKGKQELVNVIQEDVSRLNRLITDIANASRLDAELARADIERVDFCELIERLEETYRPVLEGDSRKLEITLGACRPIRPTLIGLPDSIGRVIRNLIDNALSFSPEKGVVTICAELKAVDKKRGREFVRLSVEDEGPGIPQDAIDRIFERFYTQRTSQQKFGENSGLGLSIARQIVEAHGGKIWAENRSSGGASFIVELPCETDMP